MPMVRMAFVRLDIAMRGPHYPSRASVLSLIQISFLLTGTEKVRSVFAPALDGGRTNGLVFSGRPHAGIATRAAAVGE